MICGALNQGGAQTRILRGYLSTSRENLLYLRAKYTAWRDESHAKCVQFARRFLRDSDSLAHEERRAGADAFETWRSYSRNVDLIDKALGMMGDGEDGVNVVRIFPGARP